MAVPKPIPDDFDWTTHKMNQTFSDPETWAKGRQVEYLICRQCGCLVEKSCKQHHYWWHRGLKTY